jgi:TolB-like protein
MKQFQIITIILLILFGIAPLYSQETSSPKKNRVLIYNFTTTDNYSDVKDKDKNFQYYSIIIPETISKNLQKAKNFEIIREKNFFTIETVFTDDYSRKKYIKNLAKTGRKSRIDYIISGTFNVTGGKLKTRIVIFNVKGKDIVTVANESDELGAVLLESTDLISNQMSGNIDNLDKLNVKRADNSLPMAIYKPFSIMALGVDAGYLYILGDWSKIYNNVFCYYAFANFDITDPFSLTLKYSSIQTDTEDKDVTSYSQIRIVSGCILLNYEFKLTDNSAFIFSAGGGLSKTTITIQPDQPFEKPLAKKISYDPECDLSSYFSYKISPVLLKIGIHFKRIFYQDEPMDSVTGFVGAGIHF